MLVKHADALIYIMYSIDTSTASEFIKTVPTSGSAFFLDQPCLNRPRVFLAGVTMR